VLSRGIGGQDLEGMAARMRVEMMPTRPSLVVWQTGATAAMHHMPLDTFEQRLRTVIGFGRSLGADFVLMSLQYAPAVVSLPDEQEYERVMACIARVLDVGLFRRYDIMRSWYDDGCHTRVYPARRPASQRFWTEVHCSPAHQVYPFSAYSPIG
jgi:acyl-CoA thioesterase-1